MVSFSEWLLELRDLHEKVRTGRLDAGALPAYRTARDELVHALLIAQQITHEYGHSARQTIRVAWAFQVYLGPAHACTRAVTLDVSAGGFSTLLGNPPSADQEIEFSIRLPGSTSLTGTARVVAAVPKPGTYRVSLAFVTLREGDAERLNAFLFDKILAQLPGPGGGVASAAGG